MKKQQALVLFATATVGAMGCATDASDATDGADTSEVASALDSGSHVRYLDQGWDAATRAAFYQTTQGSRMLPYTWFLQLEQATNHQKLNSPSNIARMGFLVDPPSAANPDGLPVGFAHDVNAQRGDALGLTCAACHTGQIHYRSNDIRIDGGQSLGDLEQLENAIQGSLSATLADAGKFGRFSTKILGAGATVAQQDALRAQMTTVRDWWTARIARSAGTSPHGPSRTDAFTIIGNEVVCALFQDPRNCETANAPTEFPFLWGTPDFEWV
ncbi:MAG TPA: di-heme-cytochrome C peroxidase, partial [Kofleriaceae bacterium]|nr:di-heme-cytochrome C peroxidase [Kofleriaceae bacterium]